MRKRKEIEHSYKAPISCSPRRFEELKLELLLDIRELLILDSPTMHRQNLAKVKVIEPEEAVNEMLSELHKKCLHFCDACNVPMKFIKKYKNKSGGEFHTYQCPKCKGKVDFAQIKGVGEFSVHTNIVPKEAKKNE